MAASGDLSFFFPDAELVFALTCAAGTNYRRVAMFLGNQLKQFGYESVQIRLSEIIRKWSAPAPNAIPADEYGRILWHMEQGNELRRRTDRRDFVALAAMSEINAARETRNGVRTVRPHTAHILSTLKRPEEVEILRRVYGPGLFLIGVFETQPERLAFLHDEYGMNEADAQRLFEKDEEDTDPFGQQTRETFHLADVFVRIQGSDYQVQISRLLDLIFRHPFHTPSPDEQAMFFAQAAAMRSAQLGRQVGAAIVSRSGDLLAVGCNDVPRAGGGLYWPGDGDKRDHVLECDANDVEKEKIARDIVKRLKPVLRKRDRGRAELRLRDSRLFDITEFGRADTRRWTRFSVARELGHLPKMRLFTALRFHATTVPAT